MLPVLPQTETDTGDLGAQLLKKDTIPSILHFKMDFKSLSNRELVDYCLRTDDQAAWSELLARITPTISGVVYKQVARRIPPSRERVQDLVQDTLLKLFDKERQALKRFEWRHDDAIYGYVKVIASRTVADYFRQPNREDPLEENLAAAEDSSFSESILLDKLQCAEIGRCVEKLEASSMEKDIFSFYFRRGYTAKEISEIPGVKLSLKRVETILSRIVRQVRAEIRREKGGSASRG